jgi:hypothetical protein
MPRSELEDLGLWLLFVDFWPLIVTEALISDWLTSEVSISDSRPVFLDF